ncbi:MAG TPA: DNA-deoxyinosine glycosylase [Gammaproteobacteria bacterium]|nr:DNA-deoxyinosine glycosylase [Gammaproteobacteria bacterium]
MQENRDMAGLSRGFPPVVGPAPRVLVLGSLPGRASLEANQYYAQPRNAFWPIMGALCGASPALDYSARLAALVDAGVALWDVLLEATRPGSLDSSIVTASQRINDIASLIACHETIGLVAFNGLKAAGIFRRHIEPGLSRGNLATAALPSTSPAYASLTREDKLERWRRALAPYLRAC